MSEKEREGDSSRGRPSSYNPSHNEIVKKLALAGYSDEKIADFIGIATSTFYEYKKIHPEFSEALKEGKQGAVAEMALSMFDRATGCKITETRTEKDEFGEVVKTIETVREIPPCPSSAAMLLKAKEKSIYGDKQEIDVTSSDGSMTPRTLETFYAKTEK